MTDEREDIRQTTNTADVQSTSVLLDPNYWLRDMEYLYQRSYNELETLFRMEFKSSRAFQEMVIELNSNMIEFKFLHRAGIIKAS